MNLLIILCFNNLSYLENLEVRVELIDKSFIYEGFAFFLNRKILKFNICNLSFGEKKMIYMALFRY